MLSVKCGTETNPNHLQKCILMIMQDSALGYILCNIFWDCFQIYKRESEIAQPLHELLSLCNKNFWLISLCFRLCTLCIDMCNKMQDPYSKWGMKARFPEKGFLYFQLVMVASLCTDQVKLWKSEHYRLHRLSASTFGQGCFCPFGNKAQGFLICKPILTLMATPPGFNCLLWHVTCHMDFISFPPWIKRHLCKAAKSTGTFQKKRNWQFTRWMILEILY